MRRRGFDEGFHECRQSIGLSQNRSSRLRSRHLDDDKFRRGRRIGAIGIGNDEWMFTRRSGKADGRDSVTGEVMLNSFGNAIRRSLKVVVTLRWMVRRYEIWRCAATRRTSPLCRQVALSLPARSISTAFPNDEFFEARRAVERQTVSETDGPCVLEDLAVDREDPGEARQCEGE